MPIVRENKNRGGKGKEKSEQQHLPQECHQQTVASEEDTVMGYGI